MSIRLNKFTTELQAAGIPVSGLGCIGDVVGLTDPICDDVTINFAPEATQAQINAAATIKAAHDSTLPLGFISALTTGPKLIGVVGGVGLAWFGIYYRLFVQAAVGLTGAPTISLGTNAPSYNDLQASLALTAAAGWGSGKFKNYAYGYGATPVPTVYAPTYIYVNVLVAATGNGGAQAVLGAQFFGDRLGL